MVAEEVENWKIIELKYQEGIQEKAKQYAKLFEEREEAHQQQLVELKDKVDKLEQEWDIQQASVKEIEMERDKHCEEMKHLNELVEESQFQCHIVEWRNQEIQKEK